MSGGVRLTRRGRVMLIVGAAALLLVGLWLTAGRGARAGAGGDGGRAAVSGRAGFEQVVVGRDDTLWEIASRSRPKADPRRTVQLIIELNRLDGSIVQPGQRLWVPAY